MFYFLKLKKVLQIYSKCQKSYFGGFTEKEYAHRNVKKIKMKKIALYFFDVCILNNLIYIRYSMEPIFHLVMVKHY